MTINHTITISNILTDLCSIKQNIRIKNTSEDIAYNVLVVKKSCKNKKRYV